MLWDTFNALLALGHKFLVFSKIKACRKQRHLIQEKSFKLDFHKVTLSQKKKSPREKKTVKGGKKHKIARQNIK